MMSATSEIEIEFPVMRYDIMLPLQEGRVQVEGVKFKPLQSSSMVARDDPILMNGDFGLRDFNMAFLLPAIEAGWEVTALPVFSKRKPALQYIFVRNDRGIEGPRDLEGKTIAAGSYRSAATIWVRGFLEHRYGVDVTKLRWETGGREAFPIYDHGVTIAEAANKDKRPYDRLIDGEADAYIGDITEYRIYDLLENHPKVKRLFPNYPEEDRKLWEETHIYTPVHLVAMSKKLDRQHPGLAARLYEAFEQSKQTAYNDILSDTRGFGILYLRETFKQQHEEWGDVFAHGITANKATIDTFIQFNIEQGLVKGPFSYEAIFAADTLDT